MVPRERYSPRVMKVDNDMPPQPPTSLFIKNISKRFGPLIALHNVSIEFRGGEIHTVLGENGAGKTTLAKILAGIYRLDSGTIYLGSKKIHIKNTKDALKHGIAIVSQYPKLIEELTVGENLLIALDNFGYLSTPSKLVNEVGRIAENYGLTIDLDKYVYSLSFSERQRVEILKALLLNPTVLILDEPTTLLTDREKESLYNFICRLKREGRIVILITHKIDEALRIGDRITILRNGEVVKTLIKGEADKDMILRYMFGGVEIEEYIYNRKAIEKRVDKGEIILKLSNVNIYDDYGYKILRNVNLIVYRGEIHGVVGMAGTGLKELGETIYGLRRFDGGGITLFGRGLREYGREKLSNKIGFIPDNIIKTLVLDIDIDKNYRLKSRLWNISIENILSNIKKFRIKAESPHQNAGTLSGGNLQKLVVSREMSLEPQLLIAINPTKALDHISISVIHEIFREYTYRGGSILLLSEDIDEVLEISDRVSVISNNTLKTLGRGEKGRNIVMELLA